MSDDLSIYRTVSKRFRIELRGRLYNALTGQSGKYVPLYGTHLRQVLHAILGQTPDGIHPSGEYELRLDYAKRAHAAFKNQTDVWQ